jgi:tRNA(Arg) A34 adenosine deaminase TadA
MPHQLLHIQAASLIYKLICVQCCRYPYVCHAEMNAVLNKNTASLSGAVRCCLSARLPFVLRVSCVATCAVGALPSPCCMLYMQKVYVTMFPCNECAKLLIQAGIKEVIFFEVSACGVYGGMAHGQLEPLHSAVQCALLLKSRMQSHRAQQGSWQQALGVHFIAKERAKAITML